MPDQHTPVRSLSGALCPWLKASLNALEQAHAGGRLGHAWLLVGPRGIGKINLALVFAQRLLTGAAADPAELDAATAGPAMRARHEPDDHHPDLHWVHPEDDKASISVEQVRRVSQVLSLKGFGGGAKVVIVEPAEAMTVAAANALLKTLEEPTASTYLLLVSHQPGRLVSTVRSRCQTLKIAAPDAAEARRWLADIEEASELAHDLMRAPVHVSERLRDYIDNNINDIYDNLNQVYDYRIDPQTVAERWAKLDLDLILEWIAARLQAVIRARCTQEPSNSITDTGQDSLHNLWPALKLTRLFGQLEAAEKLREQRGTGLNMEMALRALLLGFQPDRETL